MSSQRETLLAVPWIEWLAERQACQGLMSKTPVQRTFAARPRCKKSAHWQFTALKESSAQDGVYCIAHLLSIMQYDRERERFENWRKSREQ